MRSVPASWTPRLADVDLSIVSTPHTPDLHTIVRGIAIRQITERGEHGIDVVFFGAVNGYIEHRRDQPRGLLVALSDYPTIDDMAAVRSRCEAWRDASEPLVMCCARNRYALLMDIEERCVVFIHGDPPELTTFGT